MKPTQEQAIAWAREVADISTDYRGREEFIFDSYGIERFATLAYEAGRKDENEEIAQLFEGMNTHGGCLLCGFVPSVAVEVIRARREQ